MKGALSNLALARWRTVLVNRMWHRHGWSWSCCTVVMTLSVPDLGLCRLKCLPDMQLVVDYQMYRFVKCTVFSCTLQLVFFHYDYFEQKHTSGLVDTFWLLWGQDLSVLKGLSTICSTKLLQKLSSIHQLSSLYKFFVWLSAVSIGTTHIIIILHACSLCSQFLTLPVNHTPLVVLARNLPQTVGYMGWRMQSQLVSICRY